MDKLIEYLPLIIVVIIVFGWNVKALYFDDNREK